MNLTNHCRVCLEKTTKKSDEIFFPIDSGFEFKFHEVSGFKFAKASTEDERKNFPGKVCITCVSELEKHHNYR